MAEPAPPPPLCGMRLERSGPVLFVDANGHEVVPGQLVVVELSGKETLATIVFAPTQLISNEPRVASAGVVRRPATAEEVLRFERGMAPENGVQAAGLPPAWSEWLIGPGEEPTVDVTLGEDVPLAGEFIERLTSRRYRA